MKALPGKSLFLKWLLLNAVGLVILVTLGVMLGGRIHGAPLVSIPLILGVLVYANVSAGRISWEADGVVPGSPTAKRLLHEAKYLRHWAWNAQMIGILSAVVGFYFLLTAGNDSNQALHDRILEGGVVFTGTFVGIFASMLLEQSKRMIEHDLEAE